MLARYVTDKHWFLPVQYRHHDDLAMKVDCLEARVLIRYGMIAGRVKRGSLQYLILLVPKSDAIRVLHADAPRAGEITPPKPIDLRWPIRIDRAKGGRLGGLQVMRTNMHERVRSAVPGLSGQYERRIVA
jgi:hypothetical protein